MTNECRECQAGVAQAAQMDAAYRCSTHGVVRVSLVLEVELSKVRAERDELLAIAAAAQAYIAADSAYDDCLVTKGHGLAILACEADLAEIALIAAVNTWGSK